MAFVIQWNEVDCSRTQEAIKINTPAGSLVLYIQQAVISQIKWQSVNIPLSEHHELQRKFDHFFLNTQPDIHIKLLRQGSAYRQLVWAEIAQIPFGETITYTELAGKINSSPRAVGNACRDNPYPLIIPCHRVVAVSGLGGYYGQTQGEFMDIKSKLLNFESAHKK
ncbi:MAG: methylated-DNA--[protein]-cysteine S-methyltransferase [Methylococcales bacterium]|jgi:methylated-DNA-[protein]-cysteine S-methyltransferase|nr:methylated-DNA--[protein]-cysteine S-methyltransferase [Methylococcales bacterium]